MGLGRGGGRGGALVPPVYMLKETLKYGSKFFIVCEDRGEDDHNLSINFGTSPF